MFSCDGAFNFESVSKTRLVSGHDFSRAEKVQNTRGFNPAEPSIPFARVHTVQGRECGHDPTAQSSKTKQANLPSNQRFAHEMSALSKYRGQLSTTP